MWGETAPAAPPVTCPDCGKTVPGGGKLCPHCGYPLMFEAAAKVNLEPDRLSFTGCFQILKCRLPECDGRTRATFEAWYRGVLWEMQMERTDPRRNRINPRVIKRKMSKWKKKRREHRHLPPLQ